MIKKFETLKWGKWSVLWINSEYISKCLSYIEKNKIDGMGISPYKGYKCTKLSFLLKYDLPFIKGIIIPEGENIDISGIENFHNLEFLSISENKQPINFNVFPQLKEIYIHWHPKMSFDGGCINLELLDISCYKPISKNLVALSDLKNLKELSIIQSPINSLQGIGELKHLKKLELAYLPKLEYLDEIDKISDSLEVFLCGNCKKIKNHDVVKIMKKLKILAYNDCGEIPSIDFITEMPELRSFRFVNTNVLDGNISPCIKLDFAGYMNKRHYSHSREEMKKLIEQRKLSNQ